MPAPFAYEQADKLKTALQKAAEAHHEFEKTTGKPDADWADWYARYIVVNLGLEVR